MGAELADLGLEPTGRATCLPRSGARRAEYGPADLAAAWNPTRRERLAVLELHSARHAGLLTDRTRRVLQQARGSERHVKASQPGELVCLDSFYIGKLMGSARQLTAWDAASSYGAARIVVVPTAVS